MIKNSFTWDYERNQPIAVLTPYVANFKDACTDSDRLAAAIAPMPTQTFKGAKPAKFYEVAG